ncbi:MAG TPA: ABC transporter substrate-binding protein [Anaerolineales bacterium]|nr:ABC transporter substrate-binding protein [Anaerolineales bacterium]
MQTRKTLWMMFASLISLLAMLLSACGGAATPEGPAPAAPAEVVRIGSINDTTGPTSDVGKDYALGIREAVAYVNDHGGVNGKLIELFQYDYGYRVPEAITTYKRFRDQDKVVAVLGWGTGDTSALAPTVTQDKMPYVSASYSAELTDPSKTPYNLFFSTDYSTNARAAITAWYEEVWLKDARFESRRNAGDKPRFVAFYSFPTPYSSAPIKAIKEQAELLGFEIGPDQDISLTALDTKSQVLAASEFGPDLVWHGNTTMSVAAALKDSAALELGADHIVNNWGYDENLPRLAGDAAEGVIGIVPSAFFGEETEPGVPGVTMADVMEYAQKYNPNVPPEKRLVRTVQAWGDVLLLWEAMKRADAAGDLSGEGILKAFETLENYDLGLGAPPVTFAPTDHRPGSAVNLYIIRGGQFELLARVDLKERWPELWPTWLGY